MKHPLFVAVSVGLLWLLASGMAHDARAAESPLVVRVTTDRAVYRLRRAVRITLTEMNTSDHGVVVATGCQILHAFITHDGGTVWTFRDLRLCPTGEGMLPAGDSRTFDLFWNGRPNPGGRLEPGLYVVHAGVDGVTGTATIRLRRRHHSTS